MDLERTLVLIKPDGVQRGIVGQIVSRFETAGLKIVGLKLVQVDEEFAKKHYTEDITIRRGEKVRNMMVDMISSSPVVAIALEGVESVELVRKMVGSTEPKMAAPGTIRGDYAHVSYNYANAKDIGVKNVIHASSDIEDAKKEMALWFSDNELCQYRSVHDTHILE